MDCQVLLFLSLIAGVKKGEPVTATTPTAFPTGSTFTPVPGCNTNTSILNDSSLCSGRNDGNYALVINNMTFQENFLSCVSGIAYCRFCPDANGPILHYSEVCDQCLSPDDAIANNCVTTASTGTPLPTPYCPANVTANDERCSELGSDFCGNRVDYRMNPMNSPRPIFLMCYNGKFVACMSCQVGLFTELINFNGHPDIYGFCS